MQPRPASPHCRIALVALVTGSRTRRPASLHLHALPSLLQARVHARSGLFRRCERVAGVQSDRRPRILLVCRVLHDCWYSLRLECAVVASARALDGSRPMALALALALTRPRSRPLSFSHVDHAATLRAPSSETSTQSCARSHLFPPSLLTQRPSLAITNLPLTLAPCLVSLLLRLFLLLASHTGSFLCVAHFA